MLKSNTPLQAHTQVQVQTGTQLSWTQRLALASYLSPKSTHSVSYPYGKLRCVRAGSLTTMSVDTYLYSTASKECLCG